MSQIEETGMNWQSVLYLSAGASLGALCRWAFSAWLNGGRLPWGTLLANLVGGYLIGIALAYSPRWSAEARIGVMTGFLGALTTFSSFSAEVVTFVTARDYRWGAALVAMHVIGSITATLLGLWTFRYCFR